MEFISKYPSLGVTELNPHIASSVSIPEHGTTPLIMMDDLCHVPWMTFGSKQCTTIYCNNVSINEFFLDKQQHRHSRYPFFDVCRYC